MEHGWFLQFVFFGVPIINMVTIYGISLLVGYNDFFLVVLLVFFAFIPMLSVPFIVIPNYHKKKMIDENREHMKMMENEKKELKVLFND